MDHLAETSSHCTRNTISRSPYQYQPPPGPRHIRVIRPGEVNHSDRVLTATIELLELDVSHAEYICLSYTWANTGLDMSESSHDDWQLLIDGQALTITENLYLALRGLFARFGGPFWVDAICINQDNIDERNDQVAMMGDIYAAAKAVVVWLGPEDEHSRVALPVLQTVNDAIQKLQSKEDVITLASSLPFDNAEVWKAIGHRSPTVEEWDSIMHVISRKWFQRTWTVQEAILCDITAILCGRAVYSLADVADLSEFVIVAHWEPQIKLATSHADGLWSNLFQLASWKNVLDKGLSYTKQMQYYQRFFGAKTEPEYLVSYCGWLWSMNRKRHSTVKRDKIYAPLIMASRLKASNHNDMPWIKPDYNKPFELVFTEAARFLMQGTSSLSVLSFVEDAAFREHKTLPSWVPDYTVQQWPQSFNQHHAHLDATKNWTLNQGHLQWMHDDSLSIRQLQLTGIRIDVVSAFKTPELLEDPLLLLQTNMTQYPNLKPMELLIFTYLAGTLQDWRLPVESAPHEFEDIARSYGMLLLWRSVSAFDNPGAATMFWMENKILLSILSPPPIHLSLAVIIQYCQIFFSLPPHSKQREDRFLKSTLLAAGLIDHTINSRVWIHTRNMKLLGLASKSILPGDEIWLCKGAKVPYVLRPEAESSVYKLVGEAYLHGYMQGEAVKKWVDTGAKPIETIRVI